MKYVIKLEELAQTILGIGLLSFLPFQFGWWLWVLLFFSPDIAMLGYVINKKTGGVTYNIFHHKGIAIAVTITGFLLKNDTLMLAGVLLFAHASFDRIWGYGLKYMDDFKHTHLGWVK
ncbi:MAG: DUF4260 domain-containing protein [Chitinophagaceae bacterium]